MFIEEYSAKLTWIALLNKSREKEWLAGGAADEKGSQRIAGLYNNSKVVGTTAGIAVYKFVCVCAESRVVHAARCQPGPVFQEAGRRAAVDIEG